ncbi:metallophosphoesterase family protein [Brumimicrobium mesophilum]|uniref:metallophosphoesterase family protein n=1 Tax=Brumimicrobium mesophilum TaxID=392717 RepID=UPI000D141190|nr:DNA repair exonuclease [Brumimicrobium mesophilum]
MSKFKFIHAADLHIESPYKGLSQMNEQLGRSLVEHGVKAYDKLIETALNEQVDFLLIAGDSFDSESGSLSAQYRFVRGLEKLNNAQIPVFIITGNHDPLSVWSKHLKLPKNVTLFEADEVQQHTVIKNNEKLAEIYGVSYGNKEEFNPLAKQFLRNDSASFAIGLLHGTIEGNDAHNAYCPFDMDTLRASNMDYWALGHIHKREVISKRNPMVVYAGNIQGRHFNETGDKGCSLVTAEHGRVTKHAFISLSDIVYAYFDLDVSEIKNLSQFFEAIHELKSDRTHQDKSYLVRIRLKGKSELHSVFSNHSEMENLIQELNNEVVYQDRFVFIDKFINESYPEIDLEARKKSSDFIADLLVRFEELELDKSASKKMISNILEEVSSTKFGRELKKTDFDEEILTEMQQLFSAAKWKCIDGLINNKN